MNQYKRPDKRRRILSPEGWQRLQDAIAKKFWEDYRDKPPFQKLSDLSESPGESPLDPDTVSRIWHRKKGVYRSRLERLFTAVELQLNPTDHVPLSKDLNAEILAPDTKAIAKPQRESEQCDESSIEQRYFRATSKFDSLEPLERKSRIQVLEEIASNKDFPRYHWKVMEFLADFVRTNAPRKEEEEGEEERSPKLPDDIQAALTVIGRRNSKQDPPNMRLDLSNSDIRGAFLIEASLQKVNLSGANLQGGFLKGAKLQESVLLNANLERAFLIKTNLERAFLTKANLQHATFRGTNLEGADLSKANLQHATFSGTNLEGADLSKANLKCAYLGKANLKCAYFIGANLDEVDLSGASLQGAYLYEADLSKAKNLELNQIASAHRDIHTLLPEGFAQPAYWKQFR